MTRSDDVHPDTALEAGAEGAPAPGTTLPTPPPALPDEPEMRAVESPTSSPPPAWLLAWSLVRDWPLLVPLAFFAIAAMIVPTLTDVSTTDDWAYTRAVEILYWDVELVMFPVVAATAVGQVFWGGLFALPFGMSLGVMRLSTVVAVAIGGVALYAILRQLGVERGRSALGTALYLFNPLVISLTYTFMTDPHFTSWMLVAVALYLRGLRVGAEHARLIVLASIVAGYAFWVRQQGALIPLAVVLSLVASRRIWFSRHGVRLGLQVALAPALMLVAYYAWLTWFNDVPDVQQDFLDRAVDEGWPGTWYLVRRLPFFIAMYLGLFLVPALVALVPGWRRSTSTLFATARGYWAFLGSLAALVLVLLQVTRNGRLMPYIPQFLGSGGVGPADVPGGRRRLIESDDVWLGLTVAAMAGAVLLLLLVCRRIGEAVTPERSAAGMVAMVGLWQLAGLFPPSYQYINRGGSLDRYLLPLVPLAIALVFWAIRDLPLFQPAAWVGVALVGTVSVMGTRDYLTYLDTVWEMAADANAAGVANERLDAGSGWDGYHLYTDMLDLGITRSASPRGSPWWIYFYAKQTDSTYLVTTNPQARPGYVEVERREVDQWLEDDPVYLYLVRKSDAPWPPA